MSDSNPQADCEALLSAFLPFAKRMLAKHGEFYPYAGSMKTDGEIVSLAAADEATDHPSSATLIDILTQTLRDHAARNEIRASVIVYDVLVTPPNETAKADAIRADLEHADGYRVAVIYPYKKKLFKRIDYKQEFATSFDPTVFA